jgi:hypothetical protein
MYVAPGTFQSFFKPGEMDMYEKSFVQAGLSESDINGVFSAVEAARVAIFRADTLRSIVILLLGTGMIFFFYRKKFHPAILISVLALITLVDIWGIDRRVLGSGNYVDKTKLKKESAPTTADNSILQDKSPDYRVLNLAVNTFSDNTTSFHHKSVGGYHGAKMKRYQQLTEYYLMAEIQAFASTNPTTLENLMASLSKTQVLNMLNTKYIILDPGQPALRNPYAFGAAWLVSNVVYVPDADSELESLSKYDLHTTAVVDERFKGALEGLNPVVDSTAKISLVSYAPNHLEYSFNSAADQLAVFSEVFYDKGWNAYIDGSPVDHVRADFVLRAMRVPKGTHKIEFDFDPASVKKGETYSLIGSLLIILGFIGGIVLEFRKRKAATTPNK